MELTGESAVAFASQPQPNDRPADLDQRVRARLKSDLNDEAQYELARLLQAHAQLQGKQDQACLLKRVEFAIEALIQGSANLEFARTVRHRADLELLARNGRMNRFFVMRLNANPRAIAASGTVIGLLPAVLLAMALAAVSWIELATGGGFTMPNDTNIPMVAFAAFLGGAVSTLSRICDSTRTAEFDPLAVFLNGALKPCIGMLFGIFIYTLLLSGLIDLDTGMLFRENLWWAIGFLSGFSERLPKDIAARGENLLAGR